MTKRRVEWLFHILAFALQCNALVPLLSRSGGDTTDLGTANPANSIAMAFVLSIVLFLMGRHAQAVKRYAPGMWPILALVLLALVSVSWSDYPSVTIRRAGSLATATLWAWYVTARYDLKDVISIVRQSLGILAVSSMAIGLAAPGLGRGVDGWLGVFSTKNDLGGMMAIGTVTFVYTLVAQRPQLMTRVLCASALLLCLGLLYLSQSRTSWLAAVLGSVICLAIRMTYKRVGVAIIVWTTILLLLGPAVVLATDQLGTLATMLGKDSTLTGRLDLWMILPSYIAERPWFGHGLGAFWVQDSVNVFQIWAIVGWEPPHAHNGWLDILLDLGIAGLLLIALQVFLILGNGIRAVVEGSEPDAQYVLVMTFVVLTHNLAESSLVRPGASWVLLGIAATALSKIAKRRQRETRPRFARRSQRRAPLAPSRLG
jgi:exopolysaccharide production protein ExoQ